MNNNKSQIDINEEQISHYRLLCYEIHKKLNYLELEIVKTSDTNKKFDYEANAKELAEKLQETEVKIESLIAKNRGELENVTVDEKKSTEIKSEEDYDRGLLLLNQWLGELTRETTKERISKIHSLRIKLDDFRNNDLDDRINYQISKTDLRYSSILFSTIYTNEKLDNTTYLKIKEIREDAEFSKIYQWHDRSLIVTALSLSLINFSFCEIKANLLLDFITDFEDKVWKKALTCMVVSLILQKNRKWLKFTGFKRRLKRLRDNDAVQESMQAIEFILRNELYKISFFNPAQYNLEFFEEPANCFIPFFDENPILVNAVDSADMSIDTKNFKQFVKQIPLLSCQKYALCIGLKSKEVSEKELSETELSLFHRTLSISVSFYPFLNDLSEFYFFFNFYPEKLVENVFQNQVDITNTPIKDLLLKEEVQILLEGNALMENDKFKLAIKRYLALLKINSNNKEALAHLASCYSKTDDNIRAIKILNDILIKFPNDDKFPTLYNLSACYFNIENYTKSIEYCEEIISTSKKQNFDIYVLKAHNYLMLKDSAQAKYNNDIAANMAILHREYFEVSEIYYRNDNAKEALSNITIAWEEKPNSVEYIYLRGAILNELKDWENAISILEKGLEIDKKDIDIHVALGRAYLFSGINIERAKYFLNKASKKKSDTRGIAYGNLGHLYLKLGNEEEAKKQYFLSIGCLEGIEDFDEKMIIDAPLMTAIGISEKEYLDIKNEVIKDKKSLEST